MLRPGDMVSDRYRVEHELGRGGFGTVFAATELALDRRVALKVLHPDPDGSYPADVAARFRREIQTLGELRSPHTVRLLSSTTSNGLLCAVFEYVEGTELSDILRKRGSLSAEETTRILRQILESLAEAHRHGILHRDLKPENIMVAPTRHDALHVKLIDFGIARRLETGSPSITATGELIGTPRYMSPEQITETPLTPASDLYSVGMIALEMLFGRNVLQGGAWSDQLDRLRSGYVFSAPSLHALPAALRRVIGKLTARRPEDRFQSAEAALLALSGRRDSASETPEPTLSTNSFKRLLLWAGAALLLLGLLAVWLLPNDAPPPARAPTMSSRPAPVEPPKPTGTPPSLAAAVAPSAGCAGPQPEAGIAEHPDHVQYNPSGLRSDQPGPLIVLLHDRFVAPKDYLEQQRLLDLAGRHRTVLVAPHSPSVEKTTDPWAKEPQHRRVHATLEGVLNSTCIDTNRVFLVGDRFGGAGVAELVCQEPLPWAGAAIYNYIKAPETICGVPIIRFYSRDNPHGDPFDGNRRGCHDAPVDERLQVEDHKLAEAMGCTTDDPSFRVDESEDRCRQWTCGGDLQFRSCLLQGGPTWPGFTPRPKRLTPGREICDGEVPPTFDIHAEMFDFFGIAARCRGRAFTADTLTTEQVLTDDFTSLDVHLFVPSELGDRRAPFLLLLNEPGVDARTLAERSGFTTLANEEGFVFATHAVAEKQTFRHERGAYQQVAVEKTLDHVEALVTWATDQLCVDEVLIVTQGGSGHVGDRVMCEPWVSGAAINSHRLGHVKDRDPRCTKDSRVPTLQLVPSRSKHHAVYRGDTDCGGKVTTSLVEADADRARFHGCEPVEWNLTRSTQCPKRTDCEVPFDSCMVDGGHPWPGMESRDDEYNLKCDGKPPEGFDTARTIWEFFEEHVIDG